jgi:cytochrome c
LSDDINQTIYIMKTIKKSTIAFLAIIGISSFSSCSNEENNEAKTDVKPTEITAEEPKVIEVELPGKETFKTNGCVACHEPNRKVVGPALKDISAAYLDNREGLTAFLKGEGEAIVDPAQAAVMAPQIEITKAMEDADRDLIIDYILSIK